MTSKLAAAALCLFALTACQHASASPEARTERVLKTIRIVTDRSRIPVGASDEILAVGIYSDGTTRELTQELQWSSSDASMLEVKSLDDGRFSVHAKKTGLTMLQVSLGDDAAAIPVHVTGA